MNSDTHILVIRHGQSTWNATRRWQGQADPPLTDLGEEQAFQVAKVLGQFDAIVSSTLQRAALTAQIIAHELGVGPVEPEGRLIERGVGEWEGLTRDEIEAAWPGRLDLGDWPRSFEPEHEVADRAAAALIDLGRRFPGGMVLAIAHGGVVHVLRRLLEATEEYVPNVGGSWFHVDPHGRLRAGDIVSPLGAEAPSIIL